jgi:aminoglycoside 3-N-acetyltransferase
LASFRELVQALRRLEIDPSQPVIAHTSLKAFGVVSGGPGAVLGALLSSFSSLIMPTFTYKTMLVPEVGPGNNAIKYGSGKDKNRMAEFFHPVMPADPLMGAVPEALRGCPQARRSLHPILSFAGVNADQTIAAQTIHEPLAPIRILLEQQGWVLLLGVNHCVNTSIHYAEKLAGRVQFTRWALTLEGVVECSGFPGCSDGFESITPYLQGKSRTIQVGRAQISATALSDIVETVRERLIEDPLALLCSQPDCERCEAVREEVSKPPEKADLPV